jgi:hypothetical protein
MPQMDGTGPEGKGKSTGRKLGDCFPAENEKLFSNLGIGMGKRRKVNGGEGNKKRLKSGMK